MTRLTWLRIFAHALICIAVAYDKAFAEELIAERDVFADLGYDVDWLVSQAFAERGYPVPS